MKKKKTKPLTEASKRPSQEKGASLADLLNDQVTDQLKKLKKDKEQEYRQKQEEETARRIFEAQQREKNKSFEELLQESNLDWKKFK
ncbi:YqkE family protein [Ammoniphilus resinae]|uniref:DUF3886 domain-containing protein n=1 Tax=Ammoniphilus resinae TaxID=861532 RepID=A0ABS4GMV9_9BACL|nr:YqkE family protein [Ammoniphilus resinae]MBP1931596.1 hypothetical protein [Ammoniphilus resinae]